MRYAGPIAAAVCAATLGGCATTPIPCLSFTEQHLIYRAEVNGTFDAPARAAALKKISCDVPGPAARLSKLEGRAELVTSDTLPTIAQWTGSAEAMNAWALSYSDRHPGAPLTRALAQHVEASDRAIASELYARAVAQGSSPSAHDLAFAYLHGWDGKPKSVWAAYYWYHHAARRGEPESLKACLALEQKLYASVPAYLAPCKALAQRSAP